MGLACNWWEKIDTFVTNEMANLTSALYRCRRHIDGIFSFFFYLLRFIKLILSTHCIFSSCYEVKSVYTRETSTIQKKEGMKKRQQQQQKTTRPLYYFILFFTIFRWEQMHAHWNGIILLCTTHYSPHRHSNGFGKVGRLCICMSHVSPKTIS